MKKLNLKLYAVAMLLCTIFVTIPPYQAQAVMAKPTPEMVKKYLQEYFVKEGVDVSNINMDALCADPIAIYKIRTAQESIKSFTNKMYLYYGNNAILQISTNAPAGFNPSTPIGQPTIIRDYEKDGVTPKVTLILLCVEVVVVVVILGVTYYFVVKVCRGIGNMLSNSEWLATNDTVNYTPPVSIGSVSSAKKGYSLLTATTIPSTLPILIPNNNIPAAYTFLIQSSADMNVWSTDYTITINNNLVATVCDSYNNSIPLQPVGNTIEGYSGYSYRQSVTAEQPMEAMKSFRLQFVTPTNGYSITNFYPNVFSNSLTNTIAIPPTYR